MTLGALLFIVGLCVFACYLVYRWQSAVVDSVIPPAPEPYPVPLDEPEPTPLNPQAAWPFPTSQKP